MVLVGCGSMGTRHAQVVARDPRCELVVTDLVPDRARQLADRFGVRAVDRVPEQVDVAIVATPTTTHVEVAEPLLARGVWCLVEKPLADTMGRARILAHPRCGVGHVERFNPAVRAAGRLHPVVVEARRVAPPTGRGLDVDVVLDLMIHDLDLVLGWADAGSEVAWVDAAGVGQGGRVDTASVKLRTTCGMTATLLASRVADQKQRWIRCYERDHAVAMDLLEGRAWRGGEELARIDALDALTCQWQAFVRRVHEAVAPVDRDPGLRAVEVADRIRAAIG